MFGVDMGEVIQFVSRSERERLRLIKEARAIYDSIFPPAAPVSAQQDNATITRAARGNDGGNLS
ncbi:hypothetical protein AYJ54_41470 [Bradyrhizobium centrolobii]|uniref:Uncharacterized protein n=1 Tax=Bradyrhizobium centrolobii TaxID=1505087 RepID=A0A176Z291_9BRAD|nr:hypothetical protein [Bradyrhizobium centrolobii]OAF14788.1 hypothetical protein AYJ54_41470 [Bradyrhizobium centrolobii]